MKQLNINKIDMKTTISLVIITAIVLFASCSKTTSVSKEQNQAICVKTDSLTETNASIPIQCSGILSSKRMIKLSFKTGGIISSINVDEGSYVKKGQILATLDMTEISAQVSQTKLAFEKAERDLKRVKNLYRDTVATLEQLQDATSAYEAALENKNIAEFNQRFSYIVAPENGKIISKLNEEHELVGPGMPVIIFSEQGKDEWVVKAGLSDKDIIKVKKGDKAEISLDAFPNKSFNAFVSQVSEAADPQSGTFEVELSINPENEKLINGLVAKLKIESLDKQNVTLVPADALTEADGKKAFVYIVEKSDTTAKKVPVTIAYLQNDAVAIVEPISKMGQVITQGAGYLEDGSKILVQK
jgi:RND family efflux transporter MFP subunit